MYVSIVNWVRQPTGPVVSFQLDGRSVSGITTTVEEGDSRPPAIRLRGNSARQHAGVVPNPTDEFCVDEAIATALRGRDDADCTAFRPARPHW